MLWSRAELGSARLAQIMAGAIDIVYKITKIIKESPKCEVIFNKFKDVSAGSPGFHILCPTRWTVRGETLTPISDNYVALQKTWDSTKDATKDTEMKAQI